MKATYYAAATTWLCSAVWALTLGHYALALFCAIGAALDQHLYRQA